MWLGFSLCDRESWVEKFLIIIIPEGFVLIKAALGEFGKTESSSALCQEHDLLTPNLSVASATLRDWKARRWPVEVLSLWFSTKKGLLEVM